MDAQATMRLMFDTMKAYDRGDFDRLRADRQLRPIVSRFHFKGRRIVSIADYPSMEANEPALAAD